MRPLRTISASDCSMEIMPSLASGGHGRVELVILAFPDQAAYTAGCHQYLNYWITSAARYGGNQLLRDDGQQCQR